VKTLSTLLFIGAAFMTAEHAWCGSKAPLVLNNCEAGLTGEGPEETSHVLQDKVGNHFTFVLGDFAEFHHFDERWPNPLMGQITKIQSDGVTINDLCFVRWADIDPKDIFLSGADRIVPFQNIQDLLFNWISLRSNFLTSGPGDRWESFVLVFHNEIHMSMGHRVLVALTDLERALALIIRTAESPGGQVYVKLFETKFYLSQPDGTAKPWFQIFGETNLKQNGLERLRLLQAGFKLGSASQLRRTPPKLPFNDTPNTTEH
jgi:hypothetical protein